MQIVIDIDTVDYEYIKNGCIIPIKIDNHIYNAIRKSTLLPKGHGRLIDADALADKLQEVSVMQRYEDVKIDHRCTVADVLTSLTHDLKGTALSGYELCPTIIEANKGDKE